MQARQKGQDVEAVAFHPKVEAIVQEFAETGDEKIVLSRAADALCKPGEGAIATVLSDLARLCVLLEEAGNTDLASGLRALLEEAAERSENPLAKLERSAAGRDVARRWLAFSNQPQRAVHVGTQPVVGSVPVTALSGFHQRFRR